MHDDKPKHHDRIDDVDAEGANALVAPALVVRECRDVQCDAVVRLDVDDPNLSRRQRRMIAAAYRRAKDKAARRRAQGEL